MNENVNKEGGFPEIPLEFLPEEEIFVGEKELLKACELLRKYKAGKANLERRIIENEQWYKMRHWEQMRKKRREGEIEPNSAWLFNSILNKHADAMDNYPEPCVLPREKGDREEARTLSAILPVILEKNRFEQTYSDVWWYKLKTGTGAYGVFWNGKKQHGMGDIEIVRTDLLNLFWEPGVNHLEQSPHLFHVRLQDTEQLKKAYPQLEHCGAGKTIDVARYVYDDAVDTTDKSLVVDWYYKKEQGGKTLLHYCKFCGDAVLYASENDPLYRNRGYYDHGRYPFVLDALFPEEGTPAGFGYIDIMKDTQMYIDRLGGIILKSAMMMGKKRFFIRDDGGVNEEEFADWQQELVHVTSPNLGEDSIREIQQKPISQLCFTAMQMKIDELKETSGNRDFAQGGTTSGVTAASAIAALQEAGSKLSRDMIKSAYRAFEEINQLCLELIRQFYDAPRSFRILGDKGQEDFVVYQNSALRPQNLGEAFGQPLGYRQPEFDLRITAAKKSAFSRMSQNELAKELYGLGFFNPQMSDQALAVIDMMDFDGKDQVIATISRGGSLQKTLDQLAPLTLQMAQALDTTQNAGLTEKVQAMLASLPVGGGAVKAAASVQTDSLGGLKAKEPAFMEKARRRSAEGSNPR